MRLLPIHFFLSILPPPFSSAFFLRFFPPSQFPNFYCPPFEPHLSRRLPHSPPSSISAFASSSFETPFAVTLDASPRRTVRSLQGQSRSYNPARLACFRRVVVRFVENRLA